MIHEQAIAILRQTKDGGLLRPWQLKLMEHAVNGFLNERGKQLFELLHRVVVLENTYINYSTVESLDERLDNPEAPIPTPALHGVAHLDYDAEGYIYWKGIVVEHYDNPLSPKMAEAAKTLGRRCEHLESIGVPISNRTAIWFWAWFENMAADHPFKSILALCPHLYEHQDDQQAAIVLLATAYHFDGQQWHRHGRQAKFIDPWFSDPWDWTVKLPEAQPTVQPLQSRGFLIVNFEHYSRSQASTAQVTEWLNRYNGAALMALMQQAQSAQAS